MTEQAVKESQDHTEAPVSPVQVSWAGVPRVNLLPLTVIESRRFRRTQAVLGAGVMSALVLAGAGVIWAQSQVSGANDELTTAQAEVTRLNGEKAKFSAVPQVVAKVEAATQARDSVMANDVLWYRVMNDLDAARPSGVETSTFTITLDTAAAAASTGTTGTSSATMDPLTPVGIGSITLAGNAGEYQQVSSWLDALNKVNGLNSSSLESATKQDAEGTSDASVDFSVGAVITDKALSHRYAKDGS